MAAGRNRVRTSTQETISTTGESNTKFSSDSTALATQFATAQ